MTAKKFWSKSKVWACWKVKIFITGYGLVTKNVIFIGYVKSLNEFLYIIVFPKNVW